MSGSSTRRRQVGCRHPLDLPAHALHRGQRSADGEPRRERDDADHHRDRYRQQRGDRAERRIDLLGAPAGDDDPVPAHLLDRHGERRILGVQPDQRGGTALAVGERAEILGRFARRDHGAAVTIDHLPEALVVDVGQRVGSGGIDLVGERLGILGRGRLDLGVQGGAQREPEADGAHGEGEGDDGCRHQQ